MREGKHQVCEQSVAGSSGEDEVELRWNEVLPPGNLAEDLLEIGQRIRGGEASDSSTTGITKTDRPSSSP